MTNVTLNWDETEKYRGSWLIVFVLYHNEKKRNKTQTILNHLNKWREVCAVYICSSKPQ